MDRRLTIALSVMIAVIVIASVVVINGFASKKGVTGAVTTYTCTDYDVDVAHPDGINAENPGRVTASQGGFIDKCKARFSGAGYTGVQEYFCENVPGASGKRANSVFIDCPSGVCQSTTKNGITAGACVPCIDSDNREALDIPGITSGISETTGKFVTKYDSCVSGKPGQIYECKCLNGRVRDKGTGACGPYACYSATTCKTVTQNGVTAAACKK